MSKRDKLLQKLKNYISDSKNVSQKVVLHTILTYTRELSLQFQNINPLKQSI